MMTIIGVSLLVGVVGGVVLGVQVGRAWERVSPKSSKPTNGIKKKKKNL